MKTPRILAFSLMLALRLGAAERTNLTLSDGRVFSNAKIVAIGTEQVSILHDGGLTGVRADLVPLDILARAHMQLEDRAKARAKHSEKVAREDAARRSAEQIQNARVAAIAAAPVIPTLSPTGTEQRLIEMKGKFPPQRIVKIRSGDIPVPSVDVWSAYRSEIRVATLQSLPIAIRKVEERYAAEEKRLRSGKDLSVRSVSGETLNWMETQLKPYLAELRALRVR